MNWCDWLASNPALQRTAQPDTDQQRDPASLRNLPTDMVLKTDWHAKGTTLLDRLRDRQQQMAIGHQRLAELAKLTGIT